MLHENIRILFLSALKAHKELTGKELSEPHEKALVMAYVREIVDIIEKNPTMLEAR